MPETSGKDGSVLVSVLVVMLVVTVLAMTLISISMSEMAQAVRQERRAEAYYIARSGADAVASYLIQHPEEVDYFISQGPEEVVLGNGSFTISVKEENGVILIESTGNVGSSSRAVALTLVPAGPVFDMAIFAHSALRLSNLVTIQGNAGTNSTEPGAVELTNHSLIDGNFSTGVYSNPFSVIDFKGGQISGDIGTYAEEVSYPMPEFPAIPAGLPARGNISLWGTLVETIDADGEYAEISLSNFSQLVIDVGHGERHIVVDKFTAANDSTITIVGTGRLYLYVRNQFSMSNFVTFNKGGDATQVTLYYDGTAKLAPANDTEFHGSVFVNKADVSLSNFSNIVGNLISGGNRVELSNLSQVEPGGLAGQVIYAPNAHVKMSNHATVFGSIVCHSFEAANNVRVVYTAPDAETIPVPQNGPGLKRGHWK